MTIEIRPAESANTDTPRRALVTCIDRYMGRAISERLLRSGIEVLESSARLKTRAEVDALIAEAGTAKDRAGSVACGRRLAGIVHKPSRPINAAGKSGDSADARAAQWENYRSDERRAIERDTQ